MSWTRRRFGVRYGTAASKLLGIVRQRQVLRTVPGSRCLYAPRPGHEARDFAVDRLSGAPATLQLLLLERSDGEAATPVRLASHTATIIEPHRHHYHELFWAHGGTSRHLIDGEVLLCSCPAQHLQRSIVEPLLLRWVVQPHEPTRRRTWRPSKSCSAPIDSSSDLGLSRTRPRD